jgi:hypothetical protein
MVLLAAVSSNRVHYGEPTNRPLRIPQGANLLSDERGPDRHSLSASATLSAS